MSEDAWTRAAVLRDDFGVRGRVTAANCAGALLVALSAVVVGWPGATAANGARFHHDTLFSVAAGVGYLVVVIPIADVRARRRADKAFGWIDTRRPPTPSETSRALGYAWAQAVEIFVWWLIGAAIFVTLNVGFGNPAAYCVRIGLSIVLAGLTTATLSFLLLERFNRPIIVVALAGQAAESARRISIRRRFLLIWVLGAAVPVLVLISAPAGLSVAQRASLGTRLVVIGVFSLIGGAALTVAAARSVTEPLDVLRASLREVENGDLQVAVAVDDTGEIGLLQTGFNQMVAGLRDRQRLHDLFGRHVGIEVARHALEQGVHLGGERREASVLFIDLIGSTAMAQRLPPEQVVSVLNDLFSHVVRSAADEGGWVNKFEGDAALCVFGPPAGDEDHARHALRAARTLRARVDELTRTHIGVDAGIGVSTGNVVAGNIGSEDRLEYTVIGDPVNEAARLTEAAKSQPTRVVASGTAVRAAGDEAINWEPAGQQVLRGRAEPTDLYVPRPD